MVPILARLSVKFMAAMRGPAMPRDSITVMMKTSTSRLPDVYRSQPIGSTVTSVVGKIALAREVGNWQLFIQL